MSREAMRWTPTGFHTGLVKPDDDGWLGFLERRVGSDEGVIRALLERHLVTMLPLLLLDMLWHWFLTAPWAGWSLSLRRGELTLRMRGRRQKQPLASLGRLRVDDYGLVLLFDDGRQWSIPPQPADVVDLYELAEHLRTAASAERREAPERALEVARARRALREVRSAPEERR